MFFFDMFFFDMFFFDMFFWYVFFFFSSEHGRDMPWKRKKAGGRGLLTMIYYIIFILFHFNQCCHRL
jgi:hypothetical protein